MNNNIFKSFIITSLIYFLIPNLALAEHRGPYVEGNLGPLFTSVYVFRHHYNAFGLLGMNANVGYQFNNYIALETGYTAYAAVLQKYGYLNNIDIMSKFIYPFQAYGNNYDIFAKLGAGYVFKSGYGIVLPMVGVGADYEITPKWALNFQAQGITIGKVTLGLLSVGMTYHFG